jgi:hypothetical protein
MKNSMKHVLVQMTGEEALFNTKKGRAKKARRRNERELLGNKREKFYNRKAGQQARIVSMKEIVAARKQVLIKFIGGCLDMKPTGYIRDLRLTKFEKTYNIFDNKAEVKAVINTEGDQFKVKFLVFYSKNNEDGGEDKNKQNTTDSIEVGSINELIEGYAKFIKESQTLKKDDFSDEDDETGKFAAYIIRRLEKVKKGDALENAMKGIDLPAEKLSKIQRYVLSRLRGSHRDSKEESAFRELSETTGNTNETSTVKPEMQNAFEKIVAATGGEYTEELALAVKNEGIVYNCLMGLFGRGNFRYEKSDIKGKKGGGFSVEFKSPAGSEMSSILSKAGKGSMFKLEHGGKSYEGAKIADIKAKMGKGGKAAAPKAKAPAKKAVAKNVAKKKA